MGQVFEIIFLALVSLYLLYRLWSVLGQETEEDKQRREKNIPSNIEEEKAIELLSHSASDDSSMLNLSPGVKSGLSILLEADSKFNLNHFINGAKSAYAMIIKAFTTGDKETLKLLLTKKVYAQFENVIDSWVENKLSIETEIETIQKVDIDTIELNGMQASIAVRFKSSQIRVTYDEAKTIIDNPARISTSVTDIWTFTRRIDSNDPNWYLAATRTETTSY